MANRKILLPLLFVSLLTVGTAKAAVPVRDNNTNIENRDPLTEEQKTRLEALQKRLVEIKAMDKSQLSRADRRQLRREVKDLRKEVRKMSGQSFVIVLGILVAVILVLILLL
jgi:hypothetical protein